jgi:hypothetical protein
MTMPGGVELVWILEMEVNKRTDRNKKLLCKRSNVATLGGWSKRGRPANIERQRIDDFCQIARKLLEQSVAVERHMTIDGRYQGKRYQQLGRTHSEISHGITTNKT